MKLNSPAKSGLDIISWMRRHASQNNISQPAVVHGGFHCGVQGFQVEIHHNLEWNFTKVYLLRMWNWLCCTIPLHAQKVESHGIRPEKSTRDLWWYWYCQWTSGGERKTKKEWKEGNDCGGENNNKVLSSQTYVCTCLDLVIVLIATCTATSAPTPRSNTLIAQIRTSPHKTCLPTGCVPEIFNPQCQRVVCIVLWHLQPF